MPSKKDPSPLAEYAENYAKSGWAIFPVKPRDKTPITPHGLNDATSKVDIVRQWWAKWPDANIGLNCGKSGMIVVDLDKRGEYDGLQEWRDIVMRYHLTVSTSTSITGGGGRHLIFKAPSGVSIKNSAGRLAPGIDIRADGGYVVLPPSIHPSGNSYQWDEQTTNIAILPDPIVSILTQTPDPWTLFTLQDAQKPRPPLVWVVDSVLPTGSLSIWYGAPGTLKSMILADLCVCVSGGKRWLTNRSKMGGYDIRKGGVLWVDFDNGARRTHERFEALSRTHGVSTDAPLFYATMPEPALDAGDTDSMAALRERVAGRNVSLIVIDNLGTVSGGVDENSADMIRPMRGLRWLAENTGAAVIVIHHQRKTSAVNTRAGETLRGHSSIEAAIDFAMLVSRDGENISVNATKARGYNVKQFGASFVYENDEHHELKTASFLPFDPGSLEDEERELMKQNIMGEVAKFGPETANQVYGRVGGNRNKVLDLIRTMVKTGELKQEQGPRGAFILSIPLA